MKQYDVIIVGAGPSGTAAAKILGENNVSTLLLDKESFPRKKTCGDGITYKAMPALHRLGILQQVITSASSYPTNGYTLVFQDNAQLKYEIPQKDFPLVSVIGRFEFDNILLGNATKHESVQFLPDAPVKELIRNEDEKITGVRTKDGREFYGKIVMDGTGVNSVLGKANKDLKHIAIAVRAYYNNVTDLGNTIEVYFTDTVLPGYFWIFPTSPTTANVGGGTFQYIVDERKIDMQGLLLDFIANHPIASKKFQNAELVGRVDGGRIPLAFGDYNWSRVKENLLLLGDAGSFVNPITAEGISYAMKTGIYAAEAAVNYLKTGEQNDLEQFNQVCIEEFGGQYDMGDLYLKPYEPEAIQGYILKSLNKSIDRVDFNNVADMYEYMVKLKVLAKAF